MKASYIFALIFFSLLIYGCSEAVPYTPPQNDLERFNLKGNVLSVREAVFIPQQDGSYEKLYESGYQLFNSAGMLAESYSVGFNRWEMIVESTHRTSYTYNDDGKLVESTLISSFGDIEPDPFVLTYSYDINGRLTTEGDFRLVYDTEGRCVERKLLEDGSIAERVKYRGNDVETYFLGKDKKGREYTQLLKMDRYNNLHQLVEATLSTSPKSKPLHKYSYKYNDNGDCIEEYIIENELDRWEGQNFYEYTYDSKNNWVERVKYTLPAEKYNIDGLTEKRIAEKVERTIIYVD